MKKRYVFTLHLDTTEEKGADLVVIIAKNMQSAIAKLTVDNYYNEDQITNVSVIKKEE